MPQKNQKKKEEKTEEPKEMETSEQRFKRVASLRMANALDEVRKLRTCIKSPKYSMTGEQVVAMQNALFTEVNKFLSDFEDRQGKKERVTFSFDGVQK